MKTILQKIGPLYGEAANGTVFGQPNGSKAVLPLVLELSNIDATAAYIKKSSNNLKIVTCKSNGAPAKYCDMSFTAPIPVMRKFALYSDSACSNLIIGTTRIPATYGGSEELDTFSYYAPNVTITPGTAYYGRVELIADGEVVKASSVITFTGV